MKQKLMNIQVKLKVPKTQFNKFGNYNYRNHEDQCNAIKPHLEEEGCSLIMVDKLIEACGQTQLIAHATAQLYDNETGNLIAEAYGHAGIDFKKKSMSLEMMYQSAFSYARKGAFNSLFLTDDSKDTDTTHTFGKDKDTTTRSPDEQEEEEWI